MKAITQLKIRMWLAKLWNCWLWHFHDWTCAAAEEIPPTPEQLRGDVEGFFDYAKMYCRLCGKISDLSLRRNGTFRG